MDCVKITRFSYDGFHPQNQQLYINGTCLKEEKVTNPKFANGVWVFIKGQEDRYLLNHLDLDDIPFIDVWEAEIPLTTEVFKHDCPYSIESISTVKNEMPSGAFFIPEYSLDSLINIKKTYNCFSD